jgi:hypothetical protein
VGMVHTRRLIEKINYMEAAHCRTIMKNPK